MNPALYSPPQAIRDKPPKDWSPDEAQAYCTWLLAGAEQRVANLLQLLGERSRSDAPALLAAVGGKLAAALKETQFTRQTARGALLSPTGYALATDAGLLLAKLLIAAGAGRVNWQILTGPATERSLNMPVLTGFGDRYFDPIRGSILAATGLLRRSRVVSPWRTAYLYWSRRIR